MASVVPAVPVSIVSLESEMMMIEQSWSYSYTGLAACSFALYWALVFCYRIFFSSISWAPGPLLAKWSCWWHVVHSFKADTHVVLVDLHKRHGPFVRISHKEVSVAHPDAIDIILRQPLRKGTWYNIFSVPDRSCVNQMSETDPEKHIYKTRNFASGYALSNLIKSEPQIDDAISILRHQLNKLIADKKSIEMSRWLVYFTFDMVGELTFSQRFGFLESGTDVDGCVATSHIMMPYLSVMGHFYQFHELMMMNPLIGLFKLQPLKELFHTCNRTMKRRDEEISHRSDMYEQWKQLRAKHPERFKPLDINGTVSANLGAGADTTGSELQAFLYIMMHHPAQLERLRQEIDDAAAKSQLSPIISYNEAQRLPFFQACIKEAQRMHPCFSTGYPRIVPQEGLTVGGKSFKSGTVVSVHPWAIHRDPDIFGQDAHEFKPDRWLGPDARNLEKFLVTFGAGYNQCPGRHAAHLQMSKLLATLVREYEMEPMDKDAELKLMPGLLAMPSEWTCWFKRRL